MKTANNAFTLEREDISDVERALFLKDLKKVTGEYFEGGDDATLEITRTENGFLVCVLVTALRVKSVKSVV